MRNFAEILGRMEDADVLDKTLEEEKHANAALSDIFDSANTQANRAA